MTLLTVGVLLWFVTHLIPYGASGLRTKLVGSLGEGPYKGLFSLAIIASLVLIVLGWRGATPDFVYAPPSWGALLVSPLMFIAFALFIASNLTTNIKRFIRHPQLTSIVVWAVAHLLANGDMRSLILFGGLGLWALVSMPLINKRDGARETPEATPMAGELKVLIGAAVFFAVIFFLHPYFTGVTAIPKG